MTPEQASIVFYGIEGVVLLFAAYVLYEWGLYLMTKIRSGALARSTAQTRFGIGAAVVAFVPLLSITLTTRLQGLLGIELFGLDEANSIFTLFGALAAGFVLQGLASGAFWYFTRRYK